MNFEWDSYKEQINIQKHGLDFRIASKVFNDPNRIEYYDAIHSIDEDRYITIGKVENALIIIFVVFTDRDEKIRLISARIANKQEEEEYYDSQL